MTFFKKSQTISLDTSTARIHRAYNPRLSGVSSIALANRKLGPARIL